MNSLANIEPFDAGILLGYSIMLLVGLFKRRGTNTTSLSLALLICLGIQAYFATYAVLFEGITEMWKYYGFMFLTDALLFIYMSSKPSKELLPYLAAVCIMCFLSFVLMFESKFTIDTTFVYYLYEIAIPTIHTYLLACLVIGAGGVKRVYNNHDTRGATHSKTGTNSLGGIP